jgi:hypothetical protein
MSMHKVPLTELELKGLLEHHLAVGTPSQLSDTFRLGIAWAMDQVGGLESAYGDGWYDGFLACQGKIKEYEDNHFMCVEEISTEEILGLSEVAESNCSFNKGEDE